MAVIATGAGNPGLVAYVEAVASAAPTPGGGSAAAVVGALAAALGEMVANLTPGPSPDADATSALGVTRDRLSTGRLRLLDLAVEDERAYGEYRAAVALSKATPDQRADRSAALRSALRHAADVPLQVAATAIEVLQAVEIVAAHGNRHVLSDAEIAAILAEATIRSSAVNVRVNARMIRDAEQAGSLHRRATDAEATGRDLLLTIRDTLGQREP